MSTVQTGGCESGIEGYKKGGSMYVIRVLFYVVLDPATGIDNIEMNER